MGAPCGPAVVQRPLSYSHAVFKVSLVGLWRRFACTSSEMDGLWRLMLLVKYDGMSNRCQLDDGSWLATEGMSNRCQLDDGSRLATENLQRRSMFIGDYTSFSSYSNPNPNPNPKGGFGRHGIPLQPVCR